ncbi:unnamed protein product [Rotaria sordida]|uniref:Uncharacterized protein n=1 Tax=Rotaria sordida TaxID=392033 RepID=A0A814I3Y1_9BILA|nr:unnamed protein product [Rotaria sordida]CAF1019651.1 unnamed protein product [Rotaria sordida]CAF1136067.1 unnamed protein product [Rotaria sordida]CAF4026885.1 unnamed protein product [Rotaria sordida]
MSLGESDHLTRTWSVNSTDNTHSSIVSGFSAFRERLGFCCCRLLNKNSKYDLSSVSKHDHEEEQDKSSYINQALQGEKQAGKDKLDKIAKTLPGLTSNITPTIKGTLTSTQTSTRSIPTVRQGRPRSTTSTINKPSPLTINKLSPSSQNTKNNKKDLDETTDSSEEESSSDYDKSSDSDSAPAKRPPINHTNKRR